MTKIYLGYYAGYEVRYYAEADCLEVRRLREVETVTDESDDGLRSGGHIITRLEGIGEWSADPDFSEELLEEGRALYAQEKALAARKAAEKAAADAEFASRKPMTVEVRDGEIFVDGAPLDLASYLYDECDREETFAGRRLEAPVDMMLDSGLFVHARNTAEGVKLRIGYPE